MTRRVLFIGGILLGLLSCSGEKKGEITHQEESKDIKGLIVGEYTSKYNPNDFPYIKIEKISDSAYKKTNLQSDKSWEEKIYAVVNDTLILEKKESSLKYLYYIDPNGDLVMKSNNNFVLKLKKLK